MGEGQHQSYPHWDTPHILALSQLDKSTQSQLIITNVVINKMKVELDNHDIGGGHNASQFMNEMHFAHSKIINAINDLKELSLTVASTFISH